LTKLNRTLYIGLLIAGLLFFGREPYVGLALIAFSVLFERAPKVTSLRQALRTRLFGAMKSSGINEPMARALTNGALELRHTRIELLGRNRYIIAESSRLATVALLLENGVLLLAGLTTVGLLSGYIILMIYGKSGGILLLLLPLVVFSLRPYFTARVGNLLRSKWTEGAIIAELIAVLSLEVEPWSLDFALITIITITALSLWKNATRVHLERAESITFRSIMDALGSQSGITTTRIIASLSKARKLRVRDLSSAGGLPDIIRRAAASFRRPDYRDILITAASGQSVFGHSQVWIRSVRKMHYASEALRAKFGQQVMRNQFLTTALFLITGGSISMLLRTSLFGAHGSAPPFLPQLSLDCSAIGFSFAYESDGLLVSTFALLILIEILVPRLI
jgi:hypothetical protein